ncbi:hypothetical protein GHT06_014495 [Daphnia sinensis]|uniref:RNA-directed DNA polymerase n=1 Tax=Daphnia sinensis TaxID=1820382 RepID=A0AAD5LD22_9CRUS|nr:hypothetical protein GHT06_014495 [Daphnia sinensis]
MSSIILPRKVPSTLGRPTIFLDTIHNFNAIKLHVKIGNVSTPALVDTGAEVSVLSHIIFASLNHLYVQQLPNDKANLQAESNSPLTIVGYFRILITLPDIKSRVEHNFYIVSNLRSNCILGLDFIRDNGIIIDGNTLQILKRKPKAIRAKTTFADATVSVFNKGPIIDKTYPFTFNLSHLPDNHKASFLAIFKHHHHFFAESMLQLGKTSLAIHRIQLIDPKPVWTHHYPIPITQRPLLKTYIDDIPYSSSIVLVKKKTGELRLCIDYRKLNNVTVKDRYPLPRIDDVTSYFKGAKYFSTLDLFSGFWQIEVSEEDKQKTAFTCEIGHFEFNRLPFGLCNAPATFQRLMNLVLDEVLHKYALVYLDDVIIFSNSLEDHLTQLNHVIQLLGQAGLKIKPEKCEFAQREIIYLGHIISAIGIKPNAKKVESVAKYPEPTNVDQLRTFLGLANYYRRYVNNFATIAHPLTELTKKNIPWCWKHEQKEAFNALKQRLTSSPILMHPDLTSAQYSIDTDASQYGIGAILRQNQQGEEVVIAYTSKHLSDREANWSTIEKELYAIIHAIKAFYVYVHGTRITVYSDHKPLEYIMKKQSQNGRLGRWSLFLQSFDITIVYRPGKTNQNADTLSRIPIHQISYTPAISVISKAGLPSTAEIKQAQGTGLCIDQKKRFQHKLNKDGLLTHKGKILIPSCLKHRVMERFHDHLLGGHLGIAKTVKRISQRFFWPNMVKDITMYINSCTICAKRKAYGKKTAPLSPLEPTTFIWQRVALDIVGPLPETYKGNRYILVMSEYTTRYMLAVAMKNQSARTVARKFIRHVILRYGSPLQILTDQGKNFLSNLIKDICSLLNIKQTRTTAYHPATDGMVERFNRTMGDMLASALTKDEHIWDEYLPYVMYIYNSSVHASTNETPHYLLFGQDPIEPDDISSSAARKRYIDSEADEFFSIWRKAIIIAQEYFRKAQKTQKKFYDRGTTQTTFNVGDKVLLLDSRLKSKLKPRWDGPFIVNRKMGPLNYAVQRENKNTTTTSEIVVHVNRMKPLPPRESTQDSPSLTTDSPSSCPFPIDWDIETFPNDITDLFANQPDNFTIDDLFSEQPPITEDESRKNYHANDENQSLNLSTNIESIHTNFLQPKTTHKKTILSWMNLFSLLLLSSFLFLKPKPSHGKEISTCDCNKPIFVGLLDTSEPHFCTKPTYNDITEVLYEVISKNEPPLRNMGYLCRQWLRQKTIAGYFFGAYDTTYQETPLLVTVQECAKMAVYETCNGNKLQFIGNSASFNNPPKGDGSWMTTQVHTIMNCELERFNVTQDCAACPIKSPFGILNSNPNSNITHYHKGHLTFIWNTPVAKQAHCGLLYDSSNTTIQHLRDAQNQLEFIMNGKPETICKFDHSFKVKGIADTYIRYSRAPTTVINKTSTVSIPSEFGYNLSSSFLVNDRTGLCIGQPANNTKELRAVKCASVDADNYMFIQDRLIPKYDQHLCVTASPSFTNVVHSNCQNSLSSRQLWKYNSTSGTLTIQDNAKRNKNVDRYCLALDIFSYQNQQFNNVTPTLVNCTKKDETDYLEWKFMEKEIFLSDEPAFIDEASHHQYTSGSLIDISNQLNDEIRNVYCESLKTKQFLAMSMAQSSPMLAGIILGLPTCQRVQADGQTMLLQQCKKLTVNVKAQKTKCGWEPKFHQYTIGKDGFTRTRFRPCTWSNGLANLNGQPHEYFNGTWNPIKPNYPQRSHVVIYNMT